MKTMKGWVWIMTYYHSLRNKATLWSGGTAGDISVYIPDSSSVHRLWLLGGGGVLEHRRHNHLTTSNTLIDSNHILGGF